MTPDLALAFQDSPLLLPIQGLSETAPRLEKDPKKATPPARAVQACPWTPRSQGGTGGDALGFPLAADLLTGRLTPGPLGIAMRVKCTRPGL